VGIARAAVLRPRLLVLDEPTAALDVSVQVVILQLLADLKRELGMSFLFVSHDLNVVRYISDRVMVMYLGQVVEIGDCETLFETPQHPYTRALLSSVPSMDPDNRTEEPPLAGDPPNPINPPSGCRFHTRCVHAQAVCSEKMPPLAMSKDGHGVACLMHVVNSGHTEAPKAAQEAAS
jgi:peptide/nickel transport system ATP-binding protein